VTSNVQVEMSTSGNEEFMFVSGNSKVTEMIDIMLILTASNELVFNVNGH